MCKCISDIWYYKVFVNIGTRSKWTFVLLKYGLIEIRPFWNTVELKHFYYVQTLYTKDYNVTLVPGGYFGLPLSQPHHFLFHGGRSITQLSCSIIIYQMKMFQFDHVSIWPYFRKTNVSTRNEFNSTMYRLTQVWK